MMGMRLEGMDRYDDDAVYMRMFDKWPCNTFKPRNHIVARYDEMHLIGKGVLEGYYGVVKPRLPMGRGEWVVTLSDGAKWTYPTTKALLVEWEIARLWADYMASSEATRSLA